MLLGPSLGSCAGVVPVDVVVGVVGEVVADGVSVLFVEGVLFVYAKIPAPSAKSIKPPTMYVFLFIFLWVPTGNRTLIESSTSSSVNRYTIGTMLRYCRVSDDNIDTANIAKRVPWR